MFKKIYEKLFAKALQAEREEYEAQLEAVQAKNDYLNDLLNAAEKTQTDMLLKIGELEASNANLLQEKKDLQRECAILSGENSSLEERFSDMSWQLTMAEEKIKQMKAANSDKSRNAFAAAKAITMFTTLAEKTTEDLRNMSTNFEVSLNAEKCVVATGYCSHCGSDITKEFCDERTALLYALLRTAFGQSPKDGLCATCHAERGQEGF